MTIERKKLLDQKRFLIRILRNASIRWPARNEALKSARVDRGDYKCAMCQDIFGRNEVHLDHILPVVDTKEGFTTWDSYINRLFCEPSGYQVLCTSCHDAKTLLEDNLRTNSRQVERERKKSEKKAEKERARLAKLLTETEQKNARKAKRSNESRG